MPGCSTLPSNASSLSPFFAARRSAKLAEGACVHARGACRPWPIPQRFAQRACSSGLGSKARVRSLRDFPDQRLRPTSAVLNPFCHYGSRWRCELAILPMSQYTSTSNRFVRTEWFNLWRFRWTSQGSKIDSREKISPSGTAELAIRLVTKCCEVMESVVLGQKICVMQGGRAADLHTNKRSTT